MPDDNRPAKKQDIHDLRGVLRSDLREFEDHLEPVELKLRTLPLIEESLRLLEERISRIERGDPPPQRRA